ncbi:hypothetical protein AB0C84_45170 [Actinomadura sp. NPDC048955]|uniref:hypothetical protein n=1 Tax=Actinomadura sp. NPDC048955 TaxID=3158228 RepID=UPI0033DCA091
MKRQAHDEDPLGVRELLPVEGGTWGGLLFDNPRIRLPLALTWSFRFPFKEVVRDYGSNRIFLDIDWLPLPSASWRSMTGQTVRGASEPAESSVYFFQHHQYDLIDLEILEQQELWLHARATLTGDLDGLGMDPVTADGWLRFEGIRVHLTSATSAESALARLQTATATEGLSYSPSPNSPSFLFAATDSSKHPRGNTRIPSKSCCWSTSTVDPTAWDGQQRPQNHPLRVSQVKPPRHR